MPTLLLLRHAKAEPHRLDDHSRRLAERGRNDAIAAREWLVSNEIALDLAVVSTAARTRETWQLADPGGVRAVFDDRVYDASTEDLRVVVAETSRAVGGLVVVGHNPGIERLAWELDDGQDARDVTDRGMPTCALAVFEVSGWDLAQARLTALATPRG